MTGLATFVAAASRHALKIAQELFPYAELADRVYLSGSRTTRLVDELAAGGLIRKTRSPADARGIDVTLTATGLARLQAAIARALE
jgi:DNA-binding MarR family transcriptional regulator